MNSIKDLLPGSMRERTFQLKARRDAGAVWNDPQFVECKKCGRRATRQIWNKAQYVCPNCGVHLPIRMCCSFPVTRKNWKHRPARPA